MMKKWIGMKWVTVSIASCLLALASPWSLAANPEPQSTPSAQQTQGNKTSYIVLQSAQEGRIEQIADKPNSYLLTLKNIQPNVSYITEKPQRKTGMLPNERFLQEWGSKATDSLNNIPPNAFIHGLQDAKKEKIIAKTKEPVAKPKAKNEPIPEPIVINFAVQLSEPKIDTKNNTITYVISGLEGRENSISPTSLRYVTLFIDGVPCLSCL